MSQLPMTAMLSGGAISNNLSLPSFAWQGAAPDQDFQHLLDAAHQENSLPPPEPETPAADKDKSEEASGCEKCAAEQEEPRQRGPVEANLWEGLLPNPLVNMLPATQPLPATIIPTAQNMALLTAATATAATAATAAAAATAATAATQVPTLTPAEVNQVMTATPLATAPLLAPQAEEPPVQTPQQAADLLAANTASLGQDETMAPVVTKDAGLQVLAAPAPPPTLSSVEQWQQTLGWRPITLGQSLPDEAAGERIMVTPGGEQPGREGQILPQQAATDPLPQPDTPLEAVLKEATVPTTAPAEATHEAALATLTNGFNNGFTNSSGILPTHGVSLSGQGSVVQAGNTAGLARPVVTTTITDFPDVVASELGKTRMISRPNASEQIHIQLDPQELGALDMQVKVGADRQVHMTIVTESEQTKELLQKQFGQLQEALAGQNLTFGDVRVEVGTRGQQGEPGRNARQSASANTQRTLGAASANEPSAATGAAKRSSLWLPGGGISIHA